MVLIKVIRAWALLLGLLAVVAPQAPAVAQPLVPDLAGILQRGALRVAIPEFDSPPFFQRRNEELEGFDIDLARELARDLGVRVVFDRRAKSFNEVVDVVADGHADVAVCKLSRTLLRARRVIFTRPYLLFKHALAINRARFAEIARGRDAPVVLRQFEGTLGVIANTAYAEFAREYFPNAKIQDFPNWDSVLDAVRSGRIVALYRDELEIKKMLFDDPSISLTLRTVTLGDLTDPISMALPATSVHFAAYLDLFLEQRVGVASVDSVLARYQRLLH